MKTLVFGPFSPPIHGEALVCDEVADLLNSKRVNKNISHYSTPVKIIKTVLLSFNLLFSPKIALYYIFLTRSFPGYWLDLLLIRMAKRGGKKVVIHLEGFDTCLDEIDSSALKVYKEMHQKADVIIVLDAHMKNITVEKYRLQANKVKVVTNFHSMEKVDREPGRDKKIRLLYLSNLMHSKGFTVLTKSMEDFDDLGIELHVAGLPLRDEFKSALEMQQILEEAKQKLSNFHYHGVVSGKEKQELLLKSDFFVLPTFYKTEAQPLSIIEAVAAGLKIITTEHHGIPYLLESIEDKVYVEKNDVPSLTLGLQKAINEFKNSNGMKPTNLEFGSVSRFRKEIQSIVSKELHENII